MKSSTMKALVATAYGSPKNLQVQELPVPTPKENELLVEVHASTVTTADTMMRRADPFISRLFLGLFKPKTGRMGTGFAGIVTAVGSKVKDFKPGDAVFGETGVSFGANSEYITIAEDQVVAHKPESVSFDEAATVTDGPMTSLNFLTKVYELKAGQHILINGASGSLGTAAIQLAKQIGAEVTAVCGPRNAELVRSLGADHVIDYHQTDFTTTGQTYDVVYDTVGKRSFGECKPALKPQGAYISPVLDIKLLINMLLTSKSKGQKANFDATGLNPAPVLRPMLAKLAEMLDQKQLEVVIDRRYSLTEAQQAHEYVDTGHKRGNVVIAMNASAA